MLTLITTAATTFIPFLQTAPTVNVTPEPRAPSLLHWGDFDGDGASDVLVLSPRGEARLLRNRRDGSFEDCTGGSGLERLTGVVAAAWGDFDADGRIDLFVDGVVSGPRLFANQGAGTFVPAPIEWKRTALTRFAHWHDYDGDGLLDLHAETDSGEVLYHNRGATDFELVPLAELARSVTTVAGALPAGDDVESGTWLADATRRGTAHGSGGLATYGSGPSTSLLPPPTTTASSAGTAVGAIASCNGAPNLNDQASTSCLFASSAPTLGMLYPLSTNFNVDSAGRVGMGTTTPGHRLHVVETTATGIFGQGGATGVRGDANLVGTGNRYGGHFTASGGSNNMGVYGQADIGVRGLGGSGGYGVFGETNSASGFGVLARNNSTSATAIGLKADTTNGTALLAEATGAGATAIKGTHSAATGTTPALHGTTVSTTSGASAVRGESLGAAAPGYGVHGTGNASAGVGVFGEGATGVAGTGATGVVGNGTAIGTSGDSSSVTGVGVRGRNLSVTGSTVGVQGEVASTTGVAVRGVATAASGTTTGVLGESSSVDGIGVRGTHTATSGTEPGVFGVTYSVAPGAAGVVGKALAAAGRASGVYGEAGQSDGSGLTAGVHGKATTAYYSVGVFGEHTGTGIFYLGTGVLGKGQIGIQGEGAVAGAYVSASNPSGTGLHAYGNTGVDGVADSATGDSVGVRGSAGNWGAQNNIGILGEAQSAIQSSIGVHGKTYAQVSSAGVVGTYASPTNADVPGVKGVSTPAAFWGIGGQFEGGFIGVDAVSNLAGGGTRYGGRFDGRNGASNYGVYASAAGGTAYAGYFSGNAHVQGTLSASTKAFRIDHPLDPENRYLQHSCIESPDMKNVYDGVALLDATGVAEVELPPWFEALNRDFRYQLTAIGAPAPALFVSREVHDNRFSIAGGSPGLKISWQVTGIRKDPTAERHRIAVEVDKRPEERGLYLDPEAFGQPHERGIDAVLHEQAYREKTAPSRMEKLPELHALPARPELPAVPGFDLARRRAQGTGESSVAPEEERSGSVEPK